MHSAALFLSFFVCSSLAADMNLSHSATVQAAIDQAVQEITRASKHTNLAQELAITAVDVSTSDSPQSASYRGDARIYPASVIKLFYLEAAHRWMEQGKTADTPEL